MGSSPAQDLPDEDAENIRVVCRLRPASDLELSKGGTSCVRVGEDGQSVTYEAVGGNKTQTFSFNRAFDEYALQDEVYEYAARPMVNDVLNGFSASIIAYGQTGAGKTYTMQGPGFDDPRLHELGYDQGLKGIIPRVMEEIFYEVAHAPPHITIDVSASYLEIYMEKARDLLDPSNELEILDQPSGGVAVPGAEVLAMRTSNEIIATMQRGARNRMVASTRSNDESSRGHAIFLITVTTNDANTRVTRTGQLYLVDLAGSEKADKTGAEGLRLDEAKQINKSLLALGNVISALSSGGSKRHVPYRDSKLTRLLKNSLGGNARTTLIINCSPNSFNALETLSTLRFGYRASKIKNKPVVNQQRSAEVLEVLLKTAEAKIEEQAQLIKFLQAELERVGQKGKERLLIGDDSDGDGQSQEELLTADSTPPPEDTLPSSYAHTTTTILRSDPATPVAVKKTRRNTVSRSLSPWSSTSPSSSSSSSSSSPSLLTWSSPSPASPAPASSNSQAVGIRREMLHFVCPLTRGIFKDPVFCADGHTYERAAIRLWLETHQRSPLTGKRLDSARLTPNYHLRRLLAAKRDYDPVFSSIDFLAVLPTEILVYIFSLLDVVSLGRLMLVCRLFVEVLRADVFWRHLLARDAPRYRDAQRPRDQYVELFFTARQRQRQRQPSVGPLTLFLT